MIGFAPAVTSYNASLCLVARHELRDIFGVLVRPEKLPNGRYLVGVGRTVGEGLADKPVTPQEIEAWLNEDLGIAIHRCDCLYRDWRGLDIGRKKAFLYTVFCAGFYFKGVGSFIKRVRAQEWGKAATVLRNSRALSGKKSAATIIRMIATGA